MTDNVHSLNTIDRLLSRDSIPNTSKLIELQYLCSLIPYCTDIDQIVDRLPFEKYAKDKELSIMLQIYQIQLHLFFGGQSINYQRVEKNFKSIQVNNLSIGLKSPNDELLYLRIKYNDLLTDYQYLLAPNVEEFKFIELVNKKLIILNNLNNKDDEAIDWLIKDIQYKILICLLLNGSDFNKQKLLTYIKESNLTIDKEPINEYFELIYQNNQFISFEKFQNFIESIKITFPIFNKIIRLNEIKLISNFLENNLANLPFYYKSIYLTKIENFFPKFDINIENLINQMIINNKFPPGTTINQLNGLLEFPSFSKFNVLNNHINQIGEVINQLVDVTANL